MVVGEPVNDVLKELESENRKPGSRLWAIPPVTGRLLWILVSAMNAREVLEIGASSGYSGTWIGCALAHTGGHLTTMDFDADKVKYARETYRRTGVDDRVNILLGDALDIVPTLNTQYDLVFLDCNKEYYHDLLEPILWRLRRGGLLIADNVISHQDTLKGYLDEVKEHSSLVSITLPIGSGEELTMVL
jgi:predicted O-methyltransferase YrrM